MIRFGSVLRSGTAVLGIVAVGLVAALVESSTAFSTGGGGSVGGGSARPPEPAGVTELPLLLELLILVVAVIVAGLCVIYIVANPFENAVVIAGICVGIAIIMGIVLVAGELLLDGTDSFRPSPPEEPATESQSPGDGSGSSNLQPLIYGFLLIVTFFVTFALSLLYTRSTEQPAGGSTNGDDPGLSGETSAAVGAAAGRAADQIEDGADVTVENEIYRAWREMTTLLSVDRPDSTTPREFAAAAVDAGLDRTDVEELTDLFESVRYGDADTTSTREAQAVEILRRIESTYGKAVVEGTA